MLPRRDYAQNDPTHTVTLVGGFVVALTNAERNEFHEYARTQPEFEEYTAACCRLSAELVVAGGRGGTSDDAERLQNAMVQECELDAPLYEISKAWYDRLVIRRQLQQEARAKEREADTEKETQK